MTKESPAQTSEPVEPPAELPEAAKDVWRDVMAEQAPSGTVDRAALEAYCTLVARMRDARKRVEDEGMVVKDPRGRVIPHPALAVERQAAEQIRAFGPRFAILAKPARRRGYMADATARSVAGSTHLALEKYAGPVAAVKTLAWMIDEAQREGTEALQKAMATIVPTYLKACAELQITPASVPAANAAPEPKKGRSNVADFQQRAKERRSG